MIELTKRLVPAADEVWRLQNASDPECVVFQKIAEQGHYGKGRNTPSKQGIYVCAPSGKFLASVNSNDPNRVIKTIERGLAAWEGLDASQRPLGDPSDVSARHRWEESFPPNGLALSVFARDLPESCDPNDPCATKWNRDIAWFSQAEARQWIPQDPRIGDSYPLPEFIVQRIVRLHLVDMVKGQTREFSAAEIAGSTMSAAVQDISQRRVHIRISGETQSESQLTARRVTPRGVVTQVLGQATYDLQKQAFVAFEMVALGRRWGYTEFHERRGGPPGNRIGFVFKLRSSQEPPIAPAFIYAYRADWVRRPLGN